MPDSTFDVFLAAALLWTAWRALTSPDLFRAVVLFMIFGLLMALAWVRLGAPDIALAEAVIGAGITGALLLDVVGQIGEADQPSPRGRSLSAAALAAAAGSLLVVAALQMPATAGLTGTVAGTMHESGVSQPVTAVLLNFRAYDTWLELGVLLLAVLALLASRGTADFRDVRAPVRDPLLADLAALLVPVLVLAGGYLLWLGTHAAGGAFQAGAMLGGAGVLLRAAGYRTLERIAPRPLQLAVLSGFAAFLLAAFGLLAYGQALLQYPGGAAYTIIVLVEAAAAIGIGTTLTALVAGAAPREPVEP